MRLLLDTHASVWFILSEAKRGVTFFVAATMLLVLHGEARSTDVSPAAASLLDYYEAMSAPKPFHVRRGEELEKHRRDLRERLLQSVGLLPLPERVPLDVHESEPLDHPWCTVRRVSMQLWPGVYSAGLLYMPKQFRDRPAPAMLCPHGHWQDGNAHPEVQKRCLHFANLGYVVFSTPQNHYEDLAVGVSHQTVMIWTNMRGLDYLESLPQVDRTRVGAAGASGGGLQTQMIAALDPRVKAATIVGLTCDFRRIMFPDRTHCTCNHFPGVMQFTDHPEISALAMPAPLQFLTMNDWTKNFRQESFPAIQELYAANGHADNVECRHFDTPHTYDRPKRNETYRWMERWLRGRELPEAELEPEEVETLPVAKLTSLQVHIPADKGFAEIGRIYGRDRGYRAPSLSTRAEWESYRQSMVQELKTLLGLHATLLRAATKPAVFAVESEDGLAIERVGYPSEAKILVPARIVRPVVSGGRLPVTIMLGAAGKDALLDQRGPDSPREIARAGSLVVLPDVRCYGEMFATGSDSKLQQQAWERNGIVWGRPVPGMSCTDLVAVLDGLATRPDADMARVGIVACGSGGLAIAAVFAAAVDARIAAVDADFANCSFAQRNLPLVPMVLQHGDILQWSALLAGRRLTLRNLPPEAGDPAWLAGVFAAAGNSGLEIVAPQ